MKWELDQSPVDKCLTYDGSCDFRRVSDGEEWTPEMECRTCDRIVGHLIATDE